MVDHDDHDVKIDVLIRDQATGEEQLLSTVAAGERFTTTVVGPPLGDGQESPPLLDRLLRQRADLDERIRALGIPDAGQPAAADVPAPSATGTTALVLPEPDGMEAVEDDEGRAGSVPTWVLRSCTTLMDTVQAWPDGLDFEGGLIDSQSVIRDLEQDALKVLAAIATHRAARGRDSGRDAS